MLASFLLLWYKLSIEAKSREKAVNGKICTTHIRQRESAAGCKPTWDVPQCSPGSCREEMRGRVSLRYGETSARTLSAKLGGTTEVRLSSQVMGRRVFFYCTAPRSN